MKEAEPATKAGVVASDGAEAKGKPFGLLAEFDTATEIKQAAAQVRDAGYRHWDVFTPFPIHGLDDAMGLRESRVGWFTFFGGVTGFASGMLMIWFMNSFDYPLAVGGKPLFSPVFAFPVSYELTILLGAFGSLGGMLLANKLPRWHNPVFNSPRFSRATHDRFFVLVERRDAKFSETQTRQLLEAAGGHHIEMVEE
ncbi:MAG: DUF3341 domain-containing protein [Verrucomicrobia bacterium]|nr:DUF3341 domain-containing protein [Verrucomicrobiota bacterium]